MLDLLCRTSGGVRAVPALRCGWVLEPLLCPEQHLLQLQQWHPQLLPVPIQPDLFRVQVRVLPLWLQMRDMWLHNKILFGVPGGEGLSGLRGRHFPQRDPVRLVLQRHRQLRHLHPLGVISDMPPVLRTELHAG